MLECVSCNSDFRSQTHPDTKEQGDEADGEREEEKEHEEPSAPVEPVAEAHHPHVLLRAKERRRDLKKKSFLFKKKIKLKTNVARKRTLSFLSFSCTTARTMLRDV